MYISHQFTIDLCLHKFINITLVLLNLKKRYLGGKLRKGNLFQKRAKANTPKKDKYIIHIISMQKNIVILVSTQASK